MFGTSQGTVDQTREREREACRRRLRELREQSARIDQEVTELVRAAARPEVGILFDMLHFHSTHGTAADLAALPPGRLAYVHMDDGPREVPATVDELRRIAREARLFPGEGGADFAGILPLLPANIPYAVEVVNPARAREMGPDAYAQLGREMTERCLRASERPGVART